MDIRMMTVSEATRYAAECAAEVAQDVYADSDDVSSSVASDRAHRAAEQEYLRVMAEWGQYVTA